MSSLVNGGITRKEPESASGGARRPRFRRYRRARSTTTIQAAAAIEKAAPPDVEVIDVDLNDIAAEKVNHGRAR